MEILLDVINEENEKNLYYRRNLYKTRWGLRLFTEIIYDLKSRLERLYRNLRQRRRQRRALY